MAGMDSRPVTQRFIYAQDTEPVDRRDGVIWVDTSEPDRPASAFSSDTGQFEPMSPDNIAIQDTAPTSPTLGDGWIDTGAEPPEFLVYNGQEFRPPGGPILVTQEAVSFGESGVDVTHSDTRVASGAVELAAEAEGSTASNSLPNSTGTTDTDRGIVINPNVDLTGVVAHVSDGVSGASGVRLETTGGTLLAEDTSVSSGPADVTLNADLTAGTNYYLLIRGSHTSDTDTFGSHPRTSEHVDEVAGFAAGSTYDGNHYEFKAVTALLPPVAGSAQVGFSSIPAELAGWDVVTWNYDNGDGSTTFDVETNDGSGWATYAADVLPPVDIADVAADTDVRVLANLSRPDPYVGSPAVPYVARRGER